IHTPRLAITSWNQLAGALDGESIPAVTSPPVAMSTATTKADPAGRAEKPAQRSTGKGSTGKGAAGKGSAADARLGERTSPLTPVLESTERADAPRRRRRPAAVVVSTLAHAVLVVVL